MALDTSVNDTGKGRTLSKQVVKESVEVGTIAASYSWSRTRTIITKEWVALTQQAVDTYIAAHAADTDVVAGITTNRMESEEPMLNSYRMIKDIDSASAWTLET